MSPRRKARILALQLLYQTEILSSCSGMLKEDNGEEIANTLHESVNLWPFGPIPPQRERDFALELARGVLRRQSEIDERLANLAANWTLRRMLAVDRSLLRLAAYELLEERAPVAVIINEAVEIAKVFGDDKSPAFVNGMLDALAKELQRERSSSSPNSESSN